MEADELCQLFFRKIHIFSGFLKPFEIKKARSRNLEKIFPNFLRDFSGKKWGKLAKRFLICYNGTEKQMRFPDTFPLTDYKFTPVHAVIFHGESFPPMTV